jgi:hypothetical protein
MSMWSEVELQLSLIMSALLKANTEPAVALFLSLRRFSTQKEALNAVADAVLTNDDERQTFSAILNVCGSLESQRAALAHGIFGASDAIPNGILWGDIKSQARFLVANINAITDSKIESGDADQNFRKSLYVYLESDLKGLHEKLCSIFEVTHQFHLYLLDPEASAVEYRRLCAEHQIATELSRLRDAQPRTPQSLP